jgi:fumarate reductase subunit D
MAGGSLAQARRSRDPVAWHAFIVHRVSGLLLVLFLPAHFWVLGAALQGPGGLDAFLTWTNHPAVKVAETLLVLALAAHLAGGMRLLFVEFAGWREASQKSWLAGAGFVAIVCALLFALNVRG